MITESAKYTINDLNENELDEFKKFFNVSKDDLLIGGIFVYQKVNDEYQKKEILDLNRVLSTIQVIKED